MSQNDNFNYCQTAAELQIMKEEGSPMGPLLRGVNAIADAIKDEFPHVAVDTLAYVEKKEETRGEERSVPCMMCARVPCGMYCALCVVPRVLSSVLCVLLYMSYNTNWYAHTFD